jgi:hypothetical protein
MWAKIRGMYTIVRKNWEKSGQNAGGKDEPFVNFCSHKVQCVKKSSIKDITPLLCYMQLLLHNKPSLNFVMRSVPKDTESESNVKKTVESQDRRRKRKFKVDDDDGNSDDEEDAKSTATVIQYLRDSDKRSTAAIEKLAATITQTASVPSCSEQIDVLQKMKSYHDMLEDGEQKDQVKAKMDKLHSELFA